MNAQKEYFVYLLSCFLSGDAPLGRNVDFEELYKLADIHDVGAIIANELKKVDDEFKPDSVLLSHFTQLIGLTVIDYQKKEKVFDFIKVFLNANGIEHIFVKGMEVARYYPAPEFRTSGDIDVIVRKADFSRIRELMTVTDGIKVIDNQTNVVTVTVNGVSIEIHNNSDVWNEYFNDMFSLCDSKESYTYKLSEYNHLLYVICHLAKHIAYRGAGIRMLMDIDVLIRNISGFKYDEFLSICDNAGVMKTAMGLISLCAVWLNTPVEQEVSFDDDLLKSFESVLLDGGSFGYEENTVPLKYIKDANNASVSERIKILLRMAFPDKEYLKYCYPYYNKHGYLYPIARLNRLFDGLFRKRKQSIGAINQIKANGGSSAYQSEIIKELEISFN